MTLWHSHAAAASRGRIDLDLAPPIGPDRSTRAQLAHQERHGRTSHPSICESACWVSGSTSWSTPVAKLKQPAGHARFDRVQRVAGRTELKLLQHRP
jgi:hypothetical protein